MTSKRFDAPTSFSDPKKADAPCGCDKTTEDGGETDVEKARRENEERSRNAWKTKKKKP